MLLRTALYLSIHFLCSNAKIIKTRNGYLDGAEFTANNGKLVHAFKNIPFALPPVGNLRYALPQPVQPWKGVRKASEYGPACPSNSTISKSPQKWIDEDCLHVNIFVSDRCLNSSCPVVFYIHGGDFNYDSAVMFPDSALVNNFGAKDVVFIIPAYRLGFAGLLTFSSQEIVPTNVGLHDIIHSLKWVQSNIESFGGNRNDVTIFGHSYGATAALLLTFSKTIDPHKKLFHKTIAMSPTIMFLDTPMLQKISRMFAERLGCATEIGMNRGYRTNCSTICEKEVVRCLRTKDQKEILRVQRELEEEGYRPRHLILASPIMERDVKELLRSPSPRPLLSGTTLKEMRYHTTDDPVWGVKALGFENPIAVGQKYAKDLREGKINFAEVVQNQLIFLSAFQSVQEMSRTGQDAYLYEYDNPRHPYHTDDLSYILGTHPFEMDENEKGISKVYVDYLIDFIKTGKPHKEWKPFDKNLNNYWSVDFDVKTGLRPHNMLNYRKDLVEYWMKELVQFDKYISSEKKQSLNQNSDKN